MSDEDDLMSMLRRRQSSVQTTAAERRARELRPIAYADRRRLLGHRETKSSQLNVKVTPTFKSRVTALAFARKMSIPEYVERAVEFFEANSN